VQRYYSEKLSAERLKLCYEIAPPRVKQYLEAEIEFALEKISQTDLVLELGCGYGRVLQKLVKKAKIIFGIDTSRASLSLAQKIIGKIPSLHLSVMNAVELGFSGRSFDTVICVQNGISAFKVNKRNLIEEATRVTRSGGTVLFSSYSERFWENRLEWFRLQSEYGLIGEIDDDASKDGIIVCKDGFMSDTIGPDEFISLTSSYGTKPIVTEVDGSSIFCEIRVG
jgi:2-polyprenyl-6-hydroxyphenyl methylase/3-demethylubiquinone-9 3-methyltransferase